MSSQFTLLSRSLDMDVDPLAVFVACSAGDTDQRYRILLESSEPGTDGCQQSMLLLGHALKLEARGFGVNILALNDNGKAALVTIKQHFNQPSPTLAAEAEDLQKQPLIQDISESEILVEYPDNRLIEEEAKRVKRLTPLDAIRQVLSILSNGDPQDADKLLIAGVAGYDLVDTLEKLPTVDSQPDDFPDYLFLLADNQIIIDQASNRVEIRQIIFSGEGEAFRTGQARGTVNFLEEILKSKPKPTVLKQGSNLAKQTAADWDKIEIYPSADDFKLDVSRLQQAIDKGQIFQAVISRNFSLNCAKPLLAYQYLRQTNPSPYQFYLQLGDYILLGASPESSLRYQSRSRTITIMPIAGTRGRGRTVTGEINDELDARLEADLKLDGKELAEHLMLVDLARNDLARISETGSRRVKELMSVYRYSTVMHMVSRVDATLRHDLDVFHACQSCFHMGTLTGAPKHEAMILIRQLEKRRRGAYGGAVGYFTAAGDMDTAIIIRSALIKQGKAVVTAGAGVVADSTPENELKETELKAAAVIHAIQLSEGETEAEAETSKVLSGDPY